MISDRYTESVAVQRVVRTPDAWGSDTQVWSNVFTDVQSHVYALRGNERSYYLKREMVGDFAVLMAPQTSVITEKDRITWWTPLEEYNDNNNQLSDWSFAGLSYGNNTDADGKLYIDLAVGGAGHQVSVYSDSARSALVAQGDIAASGTVTLAEKNASGLTGTVVLTWTGADGDIYLVVGKVYDITFIVDTTPFAKYWKFLIQERT